MYYKSSITFEAHFESASILSTFLLHITDIFHISIHNINQLSYFHNTWLEVIDQPLHIYKVMRK